MSEFVQGFQTTEGEKKYDYNALGNLPDLSITTDKITEALGFTPQSEAEVEALVKVASDAAAAADSKAVAAQTTANQAVGAAQQAQSTADDAHERIDDSQTQIVQGSIITIDDCGNAPLQNLHIFGRTIQNGKPTLDTPVPLESVGDSGAINVMTCGKNLLPYPYVGKLIEGENTVNECTITVNTDGSIKVSGTPSKSTAVELVDLILPSGSYIFTTGIDEIIQGCYFQLNTTVNGVWGDRVARPGLVDEFTRVENERFTLTETTSLRVKLYFQGSYTYDHVFYPMIRLASTEDTTFKPYVGSSVTLNIPNALSGISVTSSGNHTDENGKQWWGDTVNLGTGKIERRVLHVVLDEHSTVQTSKASGTTHHKIWFNVGNFVIASGIGGQHSCSHLSWVSPSTEGVSGWFTTEKPPYIGLALPDSLTGLTNSSSREETEQAVLAWLAKNPITLAIGRSDIQYEDLSEEELAQYASLYTNYPNTIIFNDADARMEVQYATPTTVLSLSGGRMNGSIDMVKHQLTGLPTPKNNTDAVSLEYLQETKLELAQGINDVSNIAYGAQETADKALEEAVDAHERIDDSQVQVVKGEVVSVGNSADAPLQGLRIFGKTTQNGEPKPDSPVALEGVGDEGNIKIQTYPALETMKNDVLTGIKVSSGGNYTDENGQQYIADYRDLARGMAVQMIGAYTFTGNEELGVNGDILRVALTGAPLYNRARAIAMMCNRFRPASRGFSSYDSVRSYVSDGYFAQYYYIGSDKNDIYFRSSAFAGFTVDDARAWLVANKTTVLYQLESPIEVFIPEKELAQYTEKYGSNAIAYGKTTQNVIPKPDAPVTLENVTDVVRTLTIQKPTEVPVFLPGILVESGGNYTDENGQQWICDEIDFARGKYVQRLKKAVFGGDYMIHREVSNSTGAYQFYLKLEASYSRAPVLCNYFPYIFGQTYGACWIGSDKYLIMRFPEESQSTTKEEFAAMREETPLEIIYAFATPIEHDLTTEELAQYSALRTNYPNTTIYNDSGAGMEVKYATPTTVLPLTGGRYEVPEPYAPTDAVPKSYADRIDKKVDTLREVVSSFHSNIVQEASGEVIQVYGSAEAPLAGMKVFGKTEQKTTTGKNLYNVKKLSYSLTAQVGENDIITLQIDNSNGTAEGWASFYVPISDKIIPSKQYAFVVEVFEEENLRIYPGHNATKTNPGQIVVNSYIPENSGPGTHVLIGTARENFDGCTTVCRGNGYVPAGKIGYAKIRITLVEDTSITTDNFVYEPYTGGIPSPNPDYPQALESVGDGGSVTTTVCGKNLLDVTKTIEDSYAHGINHYFQNDGTVKFEGTSTALHTRMTTYVTLAPGSYIVSGVPVGSLVEIWLGDENNNRIATVTAGKEVGFTLERKTKIKFQFLVPLDEAVSGLVCQPMIRHSGTDSAFELYKETTVTVSTPNGLPGIKVDSGGNYKDANEQEWICDEVDLTRGKYVQRVKKVVFDGSEDEDWQTGTSSAQGDKYRKRIDLENKLIFESDTVEPMLCDRYPITVNGTTGNAYNCITSFAGASKQNKVYFYDEAMPGSNEAEWRTYLSEHPISLMYVLATPAETALSEEELTAFAALHTNYPNTTIFNNGDAGMEVKYVADTKMYVDKKFEELANVILNKL